MLELALPWGMSYMIPQNGYHPLYSYLLCNPSTQVKLNCLDDVKTRHNLKSHPKEIDRLVRKGKQCLNNLPSYYSDYFDSETLFLELGLASEIPGDIEFVHTSPVITGTRPFILHLESFFSLFLPFEGNPAKIIDNHFKLKAPMRELLASDNCKGIYSHLQQTIREVSTYFNCPEINDKLKHIPIGFDMVQNSGQATIQNHGCPTFLVLCSAHQNPNNFIDRGGVLVLEAWAKLREHFPNSRLIWRSQRPTADILEHGMRSDINNLETLLDSVTWIERRLNDRELDHLFAYADFVLIPSLWLHSTTIIRSLANGCIPIVSDIPHLDEYRKNGGLHAVEGIRELNWNENNGINIPNGGLVYTPSIVNALVETIKKAWKDGGVSAKKSSIQTYNQHYNGVARANEFYSQVLNCGYNKQPLKDGAHDVPPCLNPCLQLKPVTAQITTECPTPILLHITDPILSLDLDYETTQELLKKYSCSTTLPRLVFQIVDRIHSVSYISWPALNKRLDGLSAYSHIMDDNYRVSSLSDVPMVIEKSPVSYSEGQVLQKYRQFLRARNAIKNNPNFNLGLLDIELMEDCGTYNLLRIYHLFVCYEKTKGAFPVIEFIDEPLAFSPLLFLRKALAIHYHGNILNENNTNRR